MDWKKGFQKIEALPLARSNHLPILISTFEHHNEEQILTKLFIFEASWIMQEKDEQIIQESWTKTMSSQNKWCEIQTKLDQCRSELTKWCKKSQKELKRALEEKIQQLSLLKQTDGVNKSKLINQIDEEILTLLEAEDMKWQ